MGIWWGMLSGPIPAGRLRVTCGNGLHTPKTKRIEAARSRGKSVVTCDPTVSIRTTCVLRSCRPVNFTATDCKTFGQWMVHMQIGQPHVWENGSHVLVTDWSPRCPSCFPADSHATRITARLCIYSGFPRPRVRGPLNGLKGAFTESGKTIC